MGEWTMTVATRKYITSSMCLKICPGWAKATGFLENLIGSRGCKSIADIGGGANLLLVEDFITKETSD